MRRSVVVVVGLAAASLTACVASPDRAQVSDVAVRFVQAVSAKQGAAACALLTSTAQSSASGATDVPCAQAVLNVDERGATVNGVQVWGDSAQVRVGTDVLFLRRQQAGWRVRAAGCKPRPGTAYECDVDG